MILLKLISFNLQIYIFIFSFNAGLIILLLLVVLKCKSLCCYKLKTNRICHNSSAFTHKKIEKKNQDYTEDSNTKTVEHIKSSNINKVIPENDETFSTNSSK